MGVPNSAQSDLSDGFLSTKNEPFLQTKVRLMQQLQRFTLLWVVVKIAWSVLKKAQQVVVEADLSRPVWAEPWGPKSIRYREILLCHLYGSKPHFL